MNYYSNAKSRDVLGSINLAEVSAVTGIDSDSGWIELSFKVRKEYGTKAGIWVSHTPPYRLLGRWPDVQHPRRPWLVGLV